MSLERYSAIEMFGAPLECATELDESLPLVDLMRSYNIEPQEVPTEPTDITPYYWRDPNFKYFLSLAHPKGPAVVEILPRYQGSEAHLLGRTASAIFSISGIRRIEIPTDERVAVIAGSSPRFIGQICVHELIAYNDKEY